MPLLQLPTEILDLIFTFIPSENFQQDLSRLTISQQWYTHARRALYRSIHLSSSSLASLCDAPTPTKTLKAISKSANSISLTLTPARNTKTGRAPRRGSGPSNGTGFWKQAENDAEHAPSIEELAEHIKLLSQKGIKSAPGLRHLQIQALPPPNPRLEDPDYLSISSVKGLLSVSHLTTLHLDLHGTDLTRSDGDPDQHICPSIAKLLPRLHILRLCLRRICGDCLVVPRTAKDLPLRQLVVSFCVSHDHLDISKEIYARACPTVPGPIPDMTCGSSVMRRGEMLKYHVKKDLEILRFIVDLQRPGELRCIDLLQHDYVRVKEAEMWDGEGLSIKNLGLPPAALWTRHDRGRGGGG